MKMAKLPAMPFFPADFFADTEHMRPEAAKAYLFLLGHAWLRGAKLPNEDTAMARMARLSPRAWAAYKSEILTLWELGSDGYWRNRRLTKEHDFVCLKREINRKNGSTKLHETSRQKSNEINEPTRANGTPPTLTLIRDSDSESSFCVKERKNPPPANGTYKFCGSVIRLNETDYEQWRVAYHTLDLTAELTALDSWYADNLKPGEKWFPRCSAALCNKHEARLQSVRSAPAPAWLDPL